jgi:hypothetical protein
VRHEHHAARDITRGEDVRSGERRYSSTAI